MLRKGTFSILKQLLSEKGIFLPARKLAVLNLAAQIQNRHNFDWAKTSSLW